MSKRNLEANVRPLWRLTKRKEPKPTAFRAANRTASILLITGDEQYLERWRGIFDRRGWTLDCASTLHEALTLLRTHPTPVVVYDALASDDDWRDALSALRSLPSVPCILLTSSVIDESFGDEVVRLHGYDIFSRHAAEDEIARTVTSALFWNQHHARA